MIMTQGNVWNYRYSKLPITQTLFYFQFGEMTASDVKLLVKLFFSGYNYSVRLL